MAKKFPQSYPTDSAALENRKKMVPRISCLEKLQNLIVSEGGGCKVQRRRLGELIFRILRISNTWYSLDQSFFKSFLTATDFYQQILTRKCQILFKSVIFIIEFTSEIAYLKVSVSNYFDAHWKTDREPLPLSHDG